VIELRQLTQPAEFGDVLRLQRAIWGFEDSELVPMHFLVVVDRIGGHVFGAYDGDLMVGFCFAIPGAKPEGRSYLHSHMLGVLPEYRNLGIGQWLKLRQRDEALSRGIELIEWTFDPLELKNGFYNIERLGAIVRRYSENHYGVTASPLHGGLPTDRCIAEWWISTPRVRSILAGERVRRAPEERIFYPADIARLRSERPDCAREVQRSNGESFQRAFERGLAVTGFEHDAGVARYLLEPWP
jgi:predicted GNAT superfamily acetyltransferase